LPHPASGRAHSNGRTAKPFWFFGDTAWAYFTDILAEKHDRKAAEAYVTRRASQGFNVIHCMLPSEGGERRTDFPGNPTRRVDRESHLHCRAVISFPELRRRRRPRCR
jgi:hypothetical protein